MEKTDTRTQKYCPTWDAFYYVDTREWTEKKCQDPECIHCANRPKRHRKNCYRCHVEETFYANREKGNINE